MKHNVLTTRKVETAKGPARYSDGAGLYLQVSQFGTKAWVFRYDVGGRTREMGLGSARTVSLRLARELAHEMRQHLLRGTDPIELRRDKKEKARAKAVERVLFRDAARDYHGLYGPTWKNNKSRKQWLTSIEHHARALLNLPITAITPAAINEALEPSFRLGRSVTASRVASRIKTVSDWVASGRPPPRR